jgi:quercetin dioxygenase-like cupin family protein
MMIFDIADLKDFGRDQKEKNVFYETPEFKMRIIDLATGESIPKCEMTSHVIFICFEGEAEVNANDKSFPISRGRGFVSEPAVLSISTSSGARILGIQIAKRL